MVENYAKYILPCLNITQARESYTHTHTHTHIHTHKSFITAIIRFSISYTNFLSINHTHTYTHIRTHTIYTQASAVDTSYRMQ